ncbi:MAG: 4-hydroxythreonine-4-phosphate dehydrogenase PdxA [Candidatus Omnitrophica bacterium]|nr:4-hydroxythreonine-4-phosphate dehydrogenase PdxA [Candidatus Omnitrophota bacterium]
MKPKPLIALTTGDPAGIGPEIIIKALGRPEVQAACRAVVVGDLGLMLKAARDTAAIDCGGMIEAVKSIDRIGDTAARIPVLDLKNTPLNNFEYGRIRPEYGRAAGESIEQAVRLAMAKKVAAVVTPPLQKESFKAAGYAYPGHTEMLAALTGTRHVSLMLMIGDFRVVHATLHMPLRQAVDAITPELIHRTIRVAGDGCRALGVAQPRIAVAGLNPHAGENGLFGYEETRSIRPAVERARAEGFNVDGPLSSDSVFAMLKGGRYDIVVCMYHDQGGIPMKLLAFNWDAQHSRWGSIRGVNVTLGLPIIRTSVAHGTGYEIAGKGIASEDSLVDAILVACDMVRVRESSI